MRFEGKIAIVTGGTSGIGRATAMAFAREGATVVFAGRDRTRGEQVAAAIGNRALFVQADVADEADVVRLVDSAFDRFKRVDCAVNCAAEVGPSRLTADYSAAEFDRITAVNLKGIWLSMKHEIAAMTKQRPRGGAIVNVSSVNGLGGVPGSSLYAMTKAGILGLTKSAALEVAAQSIRINALVPGGVLTPMLLAALEGAGVTEEQASAMVPMGRIARPDELAEAALWLCSGESSYVTGHSLIVDGGLTAPYR